MEPNQTPPPTPEPTPSPTTPPQPPAAPAPPAPPVEPSFPAAPTVPAPEPAPAETTPEPPAAAPAPAAAPTPVASQSASDQPHRILLVEDDDSLATVYIARLQAEGFDVRRVANGEDALSTAIAYQPGLVLLDVMMPRVSGFDVLDVMRNTPETANLKVIMLTALSQDSDKERAQALGADDYLVKSQVVISDVIERIRQLFATQK